MKLKIKTVKRKQKKQEYHPRDGSSVALREKFEALKPLPLRDFPKSVMVAEKSQRPYLSRFASAMGWTYMTLPMKDGKILVVRYSLKSSVK